MPALRAALIAAVLLLSTSAQAWSDPGAAGAAPEPEAQSQAREGDWRGAPLPGTQPGVQGPGEEKVERYGWRFLIADPVVLGLFTWGVFMNEPATVVGSLGLHLLTGPLVHLFSGELGSAGWSFLTRLITTPSLLLIFASTNLSSRLSCQSPIACRNLLYGLVTAGLVIGWLNDVLNARSPASGAMQLWTVAPALGSTDRGDTTLGMRVRF